MKNIFEKAAETFDLPGEVVHGAPRIELSGFRQVRIEGHKGIESYEEEEICVRCGGVRIRVKGSGLTLRAMDSEGLLIGGLIFSLSYEF